MATLTTIYGKLDEVISEIALKYKEYSGFDNDVEKILRNKWFQGFREDIWVFGELPYVDKVYRDSYYSYYSGKHFPYQRDSLRLAFFSQEFQLADFRNAEGAYKLQESFLGVMVIRPLPKMTGRSMLSPLVLKNRDFHCSTVDFEVLINGVKLKVKGFPHSSQNTETITCAETSVWMAVEYFAHKYAEYKTVLPSVIHKVLSQVTFERQVPSKGLIPDQISFALKQFGFGPRLYMKANSYVDSFDHLLQAYVESGIPVIAILYNGRGIGHATTIIGHETYWTKAALSRARGTLSYKSSNGTQVRLIETSSLGSEYIVMDDNYPPFQTGSIEKPCTYYNDADWQKCKIRGFIAPLYRRVYLDANSARQFIQKILEDRNFGYTFPQETIMRLFLTSSRSLKAKLASEVIKNEGSAKLNEVQHHKNQLIEYILLTSAPKFVWVAEFSTKTEFLNKQVGGLVIIDATEAGSDSLVSMIFAFYPDRVVAPYGEDEIKDVSVSGVYFDQYLNNLKGEQEWQLSTK